MKKILTTLTLSVTFLSITNAADLNSYADSIANFIGGAVTNILLSLATVAFFWSIIQFIWRRNSGADGDAMKDAKNTLLWSTIALFVMFSIWGIIGLFQGSLFSDVNGGNINTIKAPSFNGSSNGAGLDSNSNTNP